MKLKYWTFLNHGVGIMLVWVSILEAWRWSIAEKHVHRKKLLHLLQNQARVGVGYATSNPQELHSDCDNTFPGRNIIRSSKDLTTAISESDCKLYDVLYVLSIICTYMKLNVININFWIKVLTVLCVLAWSRFRLATSNAPTQRGCHGHSGWPRWPHRPGGWLRHGAWRTWAEETTGANIWSLQTSSVLEVFYLLWSVVDLEWNIYHSFKWKVLPNHEIFGPMAVNTDVLQEQLLVYAGCKGVRYSLPFRTSGCSMPVAVFAQVIVCICLLKNVKDRYMRDTWMKMKRMTMQIL